MVSELLLLIAAAPVLFGQRLDVTPQPGSAGDMVTRQFEQSAPPVGAVFPLVAIHDAAGNPFHTSSLKGRWTVVVSGCLT